MTTTDAATWRMEQAIHEANMRADAAVAAHKAALWDAVAAHVCDVPDTATGPYATTLEEVLMHRLCALQRALTAACKP